MRLAHGLVLCSLLVVALGGCLAAEDAPTGRDGDAGTPDAPAPGPAPEWAALEDATVRPGASLGGYCTFNWVFTDATGAVYIGTAGHCTEELGERVALGAADPEVDPLGTVVFDSDVTEGADGLVDFALVLVDTDRVAEVNPTMLGFSGPTTPAEAGDAAPGDLVAIYGHGMVLGDREDTRARQGVLLSADEREYVADMPAVPGDSGAPLLHVATGKALGIISRFNLDGVPPSTDIGPTMPFILVELEKAGFAVEMAPA